MTHFLWRVFLAAVLVIISSPARGEVPRSDGGEGVGLVRTAHAASTTTTKKIKDVQLSEVIQIGSAKFVKITANHFQAVKPYVCADPVLTYAGASKNFTYTGNYQTFTAYAGCQYRVELWGAQGNGDDLSTGIGGSGAYVSGQILMSDRYDLYFYIGQHLSERKTASYNCGSTGTDNSFGGGGASDIRTVSGSWNNIDSLRSRIIAAASGGGAQEWGTCTGAKAGGISGYDGNLCGRNDQSVPIGGTQISGGRTCTGCRRAGSAGLFGEGGNGGGDYYRAGGGSGWYGGGAGGENSPSVTSGASGSSYISGHTGCVAVTSLSDTTPKSGCTTGTTNNACSLSPTGLSFTDTVMIDGAGYSWTNVKGPLQPMPNPSGGYYASGVGHTGNGAARITRLN